MAPDITVHGTTERDKGSVEESDEWKIERQKSRSLKYAFCLAKFRVGCLNFLDDIVEWWWQIQYNKRAATNIELKNFPMENNRIEKDPNWEVNASSKCAR